MSRLIIGLTGAFGSGTSFLAENFFENKGYKRFSLSTILKEKYKEKNKSKQIKRHDLQEFGNELRKEDKAILAKLLYDNYLKNEDENANIVIESIRNPAEIKFLREKYSEFILIGIFADYNIRWERVKSTYHGSKDLFDLDEIKDKGSFEPDYGQKISDCFFEADLILSNNENIYCGENTNKAYQEMDYKIEAYLNALKNPIKSNPKLEETLMAAAYVSGRRSRCFKRKVGAVITDKYDRIISSGFNGVPYGLEECHKKHGRCYRDIKRDELSQNICNDLGYKNKIDGGSIIKKRIKLLELCRAIHGEESAIMNLVGKGIDLTDSSIYVTTYPCNLCANKIVQAGIKHVIYFEPYPVEEAKEILKIGKVETTPFEGVTFRAFFRFYQYEA